MDTPSLFLFTFALAFMAFGLEFAQLSKKEQESRAATAGQMIWSTAIITLFVAFLAPASIIRILLWVYIAISAIIAFLLFVPIRGKRFKQEHPNQQYDEREIMFARIRMQPGSENFEQYYSEHLEQREIDDTIRAGGWKTRNDLMTQLMDIACDASFNAVGALRDHVDGPIAEEKKELPVGKRNEFITGLAKHFGALDVGVTELRSEHIYSHIGRGEGVWGSEIELNHAHAIAITTEMRQENIATAPRQPIMAESAVQYANIGLTAVMLANAIRAMGYEARAHIDGNYRVICPLIARDAGLGEIGRHGLLITPDYGPRVRLAVVTTNLPLDNHVYQPVDGVLDFCERCKKCAVCCPAKAIPAGERVEINGALRWQIDQEKCYQFWTRSGTDCGRCMAVCPLARGNHWIHRTLRKAVFRSVLFRRIYVPLDRWLYGAKPKPKDAPEWLEFEE